MQADDPLRHRLRQRAVDQVDDALAGRDAAVDRGRMRAVEDRAFGRGDGQRPREAGIRQDGRIDHRLDRVIDGREQRRVGHVDAGAHLRRAFEVQPHLVAGDRDGHRDRQHAVDLRIVEDVVEAVDAVRDRGDAGAHLALGVVLQRLAGGEHGVACRIWRTAPGSAARRAGWPPSARAGPTGARAAPGSSAGSGRARPSAARRRGRAGSAGCAGLPDRCGRGRDRRSRRGARG